ncbi:MAG: lipopolysaccharide heptosyltransferase II [Myxococcota bacterium]|nr:lipopolysaccharide heptosyltransferase II [Myxococcota bacterium]
MLDPSKADHSLARRILVRAPNWTGDVIMATPGLRALRARFPEAQIDLHLRESQMPLLHGAPFVDELLPVRSYHAGAGAWLAEARELRRRRYELGVCLPDSFSSALLMRLAGVERVVGYDRGGRGLLLHQRVPVPGGARGGERLMLARERHVLGLMGALGADTSDTRLELHVTDSEAAEARALLGSDSAPLALLAPGASYGPSKLWPAERFAAVGDALAADGARIAVLGTADERRLTAAVAQAMKAEALDLGGRLGIGALKAVIRRAGVLVCNDAGARHVAVALGVPCVVVMGPTALEKTDCNLEHVSVLHADVACRPCYERECPIDHRCMTRVGPDVVAEEARRALASGPAFAGHTRVVGVS